MKEISIDQIMIKNRQYRKQHQDNIFTPELEINSLNELFSESNIKFCSKTLSEEDCQIIKSKWYIIKSKLNDEDIIKSIQNNIERLEAYHLIPSNILKQINDNNFKAVYSILKILEFIPIKFFWYTRIIHEFVPFIDLNISNILEIIKLFRYYNISIDDNEISKYMFFLNNISQNINCVSPNVMEIKKSNDLIQSFTLRGNPTLQINKSGYNLTINEITQNLRNELNRVNETKDINYRCPDYGAEYALSQTDDDYIDNFENKKKKFTLDLDRSGSYNISFSIPCDYSDINKYKIKNIKSLFVLQILEPLLYSIYSSCDPRSVYKENFTEGSYVLSCLLLKDYEIKNERDIFDNNDNKNYIESLKNVFKYTNKFKNLSKFQLINDDYIPFFINFKFWENFNHNYLDEFLKIISLIICNDYEQPVMIKEPWENDYWKKTLGNILVNGWTSKISKGYCQLVEDSMGINLNIHDEVIYPKKILDTIIDILFDKSLNEGLYWYTVNDEKKMENKPKITNVNRNSWETAFRNIDTDISIKILLLFKKNIKYELEEFKTRFIQTKWYYNIEEILEYLVSEGLINLQFDGNQKLYYIN